MDAPVSAQEHPWHRPTFLTNAWLPVPWCARESVLPAWTRPLFAGSRAWRALRAGGSGVV